MPGLFGDGLKKNVIYDFLNDNNIDQIHPGGIFQFYYLNHLAHDISIALQHDIRILNVTTEPVCIDDLSMRCLGTSYHNPGIESAPASYDVKSIYAELFGGQNGYLYSKEQVLKDLDEYVKAYSAAI